MTLAWAISETAVLTCRTPLVFSSFGFEGKSGWLVGEGLVHPATTRTRDVNDVERRAGNVALPGSSLDRKSKHKEAVSVCMTLQACTTSGKEHCYCHPGQFTRRQRQGWPCCRDGKEGTYILEKKEHPMPKWHCWNGLSNDEASNRTA